MKRTYFFLGPARSGSKWLASFLDGATSLVARHEHMLNHDIRPEDSPLKRTGTDFARLAEDRSARRELLIAARAQREALDSDYAEVNVYLETSLDLLAEIFPEATRVFLHRDPKDVVRSILSRGWYDTPEDPRHRRVDTPDWESSGQFARACHYVADTDRRLIAACPHRIPFESASRDLADLTARLAQLGIAVDPRRASEAHAQVVNATGQHNFPPPTAWTAEQHALYREICGGVAEQMGYSADLAAGASPPRAAPSSTPGRDTTPTIVLDGALPSPDRWRLAGFQYAPGPGGSVVINKAPGKDGNRHLTLGGAVWKDGASENGARGWPSKRGTFLSGTISAQVSDDGYLTIRLLGFGPDGALVQKSSLGVLSHERGTATLSSRLHPDAARFDIALYAAAATTPSAITLQRADVALVPLPPGYEATA